MKIIKVATVQGLLTGFKDCSEELNLLNIPP